MHTGTARRSRLRSRTHRGGTTGEPLRNQITWMTATNRPVQTQRGGGESDTEPFNWQVEVSLLCLHRGQSSTVLIVHVQRVLPRDAHSEGTRVAAHHHSSSSSSVLSLPSFRLLLFIAVLPPAARHLLNLLLRDVESSPTATAVSVHALV